MIELVEICLLENLAEGQAHGFEVAGNRLAVCRQGELVFAVDARCPHNGGPLDMGRVEEGELICPWHRWRFRLKDGRCTTVRGNTLRTFSCHVRDGRVLVEVRR